MAAPTLVEGDRNLGKEVADALRNDEKLKPTTMLWHYDEDAREWRFIVATENIRKRGAQASYLRIRNLLKKANLLDKLPLRRVVVADPSEPLISAVVQYASSSEDDGSADTGIYDCNLFGIEIAGAHLYHLPKAAKKAGLLVGQANGPGRAAVHT